MFWSRLVPVALKRTREENFTENVGATGGKQVPVSTSPVNSNNRITNAFTVGGLQIPISTPRVDCTLIGQQEPPSTSPIDGNNIVGGQPLSPINPPADIHTIFSRNTRVRESTDSDSTSCGSSTDSDSTDDSSLNIMEGEYIRALTELTQKLLSKDVIISNFHGYESEDINRWFEKLELILESKGIRLDVPAAKTQLINNLAGPAETFMFEIPAEQRGDYDNLKQALLKRYSTKDRAWVKRQRLVARRQGPNELLSDYINDMHELFSGLNMAEVDKVTYFTEGLIQSVKVKVLERMPETLLQAEEVARTVDSISRRMTGNTENSQIERLIEAINRNQQVPVNTTGACVPPNASQQQSLQAQMETLTKKLAELSPAATKSNKVAAYSEPQRDYQDKFDPTEMMKRIERMESHLLNQITSLDRRVDARFNGFAQRRQETRGHQERSRDGRPVCFSCGMSGHYQNSCPQRRNRERQPAPRYALPAPDTSMRSTGFQTRPRALPPPRQPNHVAAFDNESDPSLGQFMGATVPNSQFEDASELDGPDHPGDWDYYYDYETRQEEYDCLDAFDLGPGEGETISQPAVSALTEGPKDTLTSDQFLLPCDQFTQPWLTLLPTEPSSTDFARNPGLHTSDQTLKNSHSDSPFQEDTSDQLDPPLFQLPPLSDEEYSSHDESKCVAMFDLPAPVPYPLWPTDRHTQTTDTGDLRHHDSDPQTPPPVMVVKLPPQDVKPPPYPGIEDVCSPNLSDPWELQEIVIEQPSPQPEKPSFAEVVSRVPPSLQTDRTIQYLTAKGDNSTHTHTAKQVKGGKDRTGFTCGGVITESPATVNPEIKTKDSIDNPVTVTDDRGTSVNEVHHADSSIKPAQTPQTVPKTVQGNRSNSLSPDTGQSTSTFNRNIGACSTRMSKPQDLTVEVRIRGKPTRRRYDQQPRPRIRDRRPICFKCNSPGHYQYNCPENVYYCSYHQCDLPQQQLPEEYPISSQPAAQASSDSSAANPRENQCFNGFRLAGGSETPVGPVPRKRVTYVGAFNTFSGKKHFPRHTNRPRNQTSHARTFHHRDQPSGNQLPEPSKHVYKEDIKVTVSSPTEGDLKKINRQVTIISKEEPLSEQIPQIQKCNTSNNVQQPEKKRHVAEFVSSNVFLSGRLQGHPVDLLIDTGACISAINENLVKKIYGREYAAKMTDGLVPSVNAISGDRVPVLGQIDIPVEISGVVYQSQFHVMQNLPFEAILGSDFLVEKDAVIDLKNKCVSLVDKSSKLKKTSVPKSERVMATYVSRPFKKAKPAKLMSAVKTDFDDHKKAQRLTILPRNTTECRSVHGSLTSSLWLLFLVVLYLCATSQAKSLERMRPVKETKSCECYSGNRIVCNASENVSTRSLEHDSELITRIFAHNWQDPFTSSKFQSNFSCLPFALALSDLSPSVGNLTGELQKERTRAVRQLCVKEIPKSFVASHKL